ncbi:CrcB-like protein [Pseudobacteroides cellulosolvens ATCC 35603 = DSM 2933]|uniref:Fluoride-specific ion channel FluC n=1 Tax=Pseudobacteroides cellulosolvens ATCC 35603 = DSM 2933 TaxID=398512 RepID=A0A0L6JWD2_9FIRM|nr:fluoride efflux transporter CrcB [Pseudobacteroides cellulosolvens]KNY30153.1 CrcB-like protein [Pseudobacteroides cellulosolvens ATCC 35603 = DSM 2933]
MDKILCVGIGGFIGAALRYLISTGAVRVFKSDFSFGTLIVNVIGAVLIGFIMQLSIYPSFITPNMKLFLTTGILGGLTTFSTFSFETVSLYQSGRYFLCLVILFLT